MWTLATAPELQIKPVESGPGYNMWQKEELYNVDVSHSCCLRCMLMLTFSSCVSTLLSKSKTDSETCKNHKSLLFSLKCVHLAFRVQVMLHLYTVKIHMLVCLHHHVPLGPSFCGYHRYYHNHRRTLRSVLSFIFILKSDIIDHC